MHDTALRGLVLGPAPVAFLGGPHFPSSIGERNESGRRGPASRSNFDRLYFRDFMYIIYKMPERVDVKFQKHVVSIKANKKAVINACPTIRLRYKIYL